METTPESKSMTWDEANLAQAKLETSVYIACPVGGQVQKRIEEALALKLIYYIDRFCLQKKIVKGKERGEEC